MDNPRYVEISCADQLPQAFQEKSTIRLVVVGNVAWCNQAVGKAKDKATDIQTRMVLWIQNADTIPQQLKNHLLGSSNSGACALAMNLGVAARLDESTAVRPTKIMEAFGQAEKYTGPGYCMQHGPFQGNACSQCPREQPIG